MDVIMANLNRQFFLIHLNEMEIILETLEKRIEHVRQKLVLLRGAGATLKLKCKLILTNKINFIEYLIRLRRLESSANTAYAIQKL